MAITFVKEVAETQSKTNPHTTLSLTVPAGGVALGNTVFVTVAMDDASGTVSITDTGGNSYAVLATRDNNAMDQGVGSGTARCVLLAAVITAALVSGNTIAITHPSVVASAAVAGEFSNVTLTQTANSGHSVTGTAHGGASGGSPAVGGPGVANVLVLAAYAIEQADESFTYTDVTKVGDLGTTGGGAAGNMCAAQGYTITSLGDVGWRITGASSRNAACVVTALCEAITPVISQANNESGTASTDDAGIGTVAWSSVPSEVRSDNNRNSVTLIAGQTSHYAKTINMVFVLPSRQVPVGIQVDVECRDNLAVPQDLTAALVKGGTIQTGTLKTASIPNTTDAYISFGGARDMWGLTLGKADVESTTFGVAIYVADALAGIYDVDHIRMSVYYEPASRTQFPKPLRFLSQPRVRW